MPTILRALLPLIVLAFLPAQDAPPVADLAQRAHGLARQLEQLAQIDQPSDEQQAAGVEAHKALEALVAQIEAMEGLTVEHYVEAGSPLLEDHPAQALRITAAGLKRFPDARFLWDHAGFSHLQLAARSPACAPFVTELNAAEDAFRKALALLPDTAHAHLGLCQALSLLDRCGEALAQLDLAEPLARDDQPIPDAWRLRTGLLLRAGRARHALAVLKQQDQDRTDVRVLTLRALALAGDAAGVQAAATKLQESDPGPRSLLEAADALLQVGKKPDALKLLAARPRLTKWDSEEERTAMILSQSAAALEVVAKATDFTARGPLRAALTKALGHTFTVKDGSAKPPKDTDLSGSPAMMGQLLANMPASSEKDWANRVLQVLCIQALPGHQPTPLETMVRGATKDRRVPGPDDVPALLLTLRLGVGDADACGGLAGLRLAERLGGGKAPTPPRK